MMGKIITVKIGSNVLAASNGLLDEERMAHLVDQIVQLKNKGIKVLLVSSGAVASGRKMIDCHIQDPIAKRQLWASVGQVKLIQLYSKFFADQNVLCSQVLVTKEDFRDRHHFLNIRTCLETLLEHDIVPVINENDVVSVTELMFTDNDELAGLIASMMDADEMIILSNVDGIYNGNPNDPASSVIPVIAEDNSHATKFITTKKSDFGRGGMVTKYGMARKVARSGIPVHLANGSKENVLLKIVEQDTSLVHTQFTPGKKASIIKKWLAYSELGTKGEIHINEGAVKGLLSDKATSLLMIGVVKVTGDFQKGDIVKIVDQTGNTIGFGKTQFNAETALKKIGEKNTKPVIHYDYLYLNN
jgi:glutamate 5-kinase